MWKKKFFKLTNKLRIIDEFVKYIFKPNKWLILILWL